MFVMSIARPSSILLRGQQRGMIAIARIENLLISGLREGPGEGGEGGGGGGGLCNSVDAFKNLQTCQQEVRRGDEAIEERLLERKMEKNYTIQ